jgi:hypothetical protein
LYKANKDQVMVFGFRTQYGGGKSTGFALIYDSHEALKKFEPHYRLVRIGAATKVEKASRQQRMSPFSLVGSQPFRRCKGCPTDALTRDFVIQESNVKTKRKSPGERPRRRVRPRTRRNKMGLFMLRCGVVWWWWRRWRR